MQLPGKDEFIANDYQTIMNQVSQWIKDKLWKKMLRNEIVTNPKTAKYLMNVITKADPEMSLNEIRELMIEIRKESESNLDKVHSLPQPEKWLYMRELYSFYAIQEVLIEFSSFSDAVVNAMISALGDNYPQKVRIIDQLNPSGLTDFTFQHMDVPEYINLPEVQKYLLLKQWQDSQHIYHQNILYPLFASVWNEFQKWADKNWPEYSEFKELKLALILQKDRWIWGIEDLAKFVMAGFKEELIKFVGGKTIGLIQLHTNGLKTPKTYVIPTMKIQALARIKKEDIQLPFKKSAVRSSATVEDNRENSFAGLFDSYLDIEPKNLINSVIKVADSTHNPRVNAYASRLNQGKPKMAVIIQQYRTPDFSGVWIGKDFHSGILEWTEGTGDKLVSGRIKPNIEIWGRNQDVKNPIQIKGRAVAEYCLNTQKILNSISDLEWCLIKDELIWLQYRPVTRAIHIAESAPHSNGDQDYILGIPASPGIGKGPVGYLEDFSETDQWKDGSILLTYFTDPDWVPIILKATAVVTSEGGFLSHTAIISRELNIPCITGIGNQALEKLKKAVEIEADGNSGRIKIIH